MGVFRVMRTKSIFAALAVLAALIVALPQSASAGFFRHDRDWGRERVVTHRIYKPRYRHRYYRKSYGDPYHYRYVKPQFALLGTGPLLSQVLQALPPAALPQGVGLSQARLQAPPRFSPAPQPSLVICRAPAYHNWNTICRPGNRGGRFAFKRCVPACDGSLRRDSGHSFTRRICFAKL
jgi:hypothetical protein